MEYFSTQDAIFEHLFNEYKRDNSKTFSLRKNFTDKTLRNYFIGTENGHYFAFSPWYFKLGYPGASIDLITYVVDVYNEKSSVKLQINQTNSPDDKQNELNLRLVKQLRTKFNSLSSDYDVSLSADDGKMNSIRIRPKQNSYTTIEDLKIAIDDLMEKTSIIIDKEISSIKKEHPEWIVYRYSDKEFNDMLSYVNKRHKEFSSKAINEYNDEEKSFLSTISNFNNEDLNLYYNHIDKIFKSIKISEESDMFTFSIESKKLKISIGNRYVFNLYLKKGKSLYGFISKERTESTTWDFDNPTAFFNNTFKQEIVKNHLDEIIEQSNFELNRTNKSKSSKFTNKFFAKSIFDLDYRNRVLGSNSNKLTHESNTVSNPLNQILYGPPGTGKTYHTINKALSIIEAKSLEKLNSEDRKELKRRYDSYVNKGQIVFTTFHQSMSYEDFNEGIKPKTVDNQVQYDIEDGVLKKICFEANKKTESNFETAYNSLIKEIADSDNEILTLKTKTEKEFGISVNSNNNLSLHTGKHKKQQGVLTKEKIYKQLSGDNVFEGWESYLYGVENYLKEKHNFSLNPQNKRKNYILIIDEINRGNVSSIFGELITLIEEDKRLGKDEAIEVTLPYSKSTFGVPSNLYIVGTMNTADRSVEALDTALRRRFTFEEMPPKPEVLEKEHKSNGIIEINDTEINLVDILRIINKRIEILLDKDHLIGHSFFINVKSADDLKKTFARNIIPLLQEYFYGDYGKISLVLGEGFCKGELGKNGNSIFAKITSDYDASAYDEKLVFTIADVMSLKDDEFLNAILNLLS